MLSIYFFTQSVYSQVPKMVIDQYEKAKTTGIK